MARNMGINLRNMSTAVSFTYAAKRYQRLMEMEEETHNAAVTHLSGQFDTPGGSGGHKVTLQSAEGG